MKRFLVVVLLVAGGLTGCKTEYVEQSDAGAPQDAQTQDDAAPSAAPTSTPAPVRPRVRLDHDEHHLERLDRRQRRRRPPQRRLPRVGSRLLLPARPLGPGQLAGPERLGGLVHLLPPGERDPARPRGRVRVEQDRVAEFVFQDNAGDPATREFVEGWISGYDLPFPVGVDATFKMGLYFDSGASPPTSSSHCATSSSTVPRSRPCRSCRSTPASPRTSSGRPQRPRHQDAIADAPNLPRSDPRRDRGGLRPGRPRHQRRRTRHQLHAEGRRRAVRSLADNFGKNVVLLDFWATWCVPCEAEMPHLQRLYQRHKDKGSCSSASPWTGRRRWPAWRPTCAAWGSRSRCCSTRRRRSPTSTTRSGRRR